MICDQFDVLYKEGAKSGRVMAIALHPYLIGVPHRIGALRCGIKVHLQAQEGLEGYRRGNCGSLSGAIGRRRCQEQIARQGSRRKARGGTSSRSTVMKSIRSLTAARLSAWRCSERPARAPRTTCRSAPSARRRPTSGRSISASRRDSSTRPTSRSTSSTCSRARIWCSSSPLARSTSPCRPGWSIRSARSTRRRRDLDRAA